MKLVSILMPVYNAESHLGEALDSMLNQSYDIQEFIIIDDASDDNSSAILADYAAKDKRIILTRNMTNLGVTKSLNIGLNQCRGEFIARMDADDISEPNRIREQVSFLESNPEVGLVGSYYTTIEDAPRVIKPPCSHQNIREKLLLGNCIGHPTIMFRKSLITEHQIIYPNIAYAQDYEFYAQFIKISRLANLPLTLLRYRVHDGQISLDKKEEQTRCADQTRKRYISMLIERQVSNEEFETHRMLAYPSARNKNELSKLANWVNYLDQRKTWSSDIFRTRYNSILEYSIDANGVGLIAKYFDLSSNKLDRVGVQFLARYFLAKLKNITRQKSKGVR